MKNQCLYRKMLIVTDLSEAMTKVIRCVSRIGELFCEEVKLLHVLPGDHDAFDITSDMDTLLTSQALMLRAADMNVTYSFAFGNPSQEINRCIREEGHQLLVLGSHGKSRIREILLGSTAGSIIDSLIVPTLLVKNAASETAICPLDITGRFLYLTDFSANAEAAFEALLSIVPYFSAAVTLYHVHDMSRLLVDFDERVEEYNRIDNERLLAL